ncbi:hypothetical protein [Janthinobacterium sp.]|uniref:hypothetical protein n=1 Tax=Janthinobacterium sp. TaxID=1871054 RepID=UPI002629F227|nr:hypothetical protein [Janthinobacterium sp.]
MNILPHAGLLLLMTALPWRRLCRSYRDRARPACTPPLPPAGPMQQAAAPFDQAHLNAMFGHDPRLQGEILTLFVSETRDRLADMDHALRCGRSAPARMLAQQILDTSSAMGLGQMQSLAQHAVHAGFANDIGTQRLLHAALLAALEVLVRTLGRLEDGARGSGQAPAQSRP